MRNRHEHRTGISEEAAFELGRVYSAVKDELVAFAAKEGSPYSFPDVATRVAKLLQAEALREELRDSQRLPEMRQNGAGYYRRGPAQPRYDELAAAASLPAGSFADEPLSGRGRRVSAATRRKIAAAQRRSWREHREERRQAALNGRYPHRPQRDWAREYAARKEREAGGRKRMDGTPDRRGTPEARAKQAKSMKRYYQDPKWRKAMLKRMKAMRARKDGKPTHPMSEATKAKLRAARYAAIERKNKGLQGGAA